MSNSTTASNHADAALLPLVDVIEDAAGITLYADLPGVSKDKLGVHVDNDTLTIEGEVTLNLPEALQATHTELSVPRYRRAFTLSKELDSSRIAAEFKQGVLSLRIPKAEHAQPKKVAVTVH